MSKTNNERLQEIAEGMQSLNERLVYVGGAIAGFAGSQCLAFAFPSFVTCIAYAGSGFVLFLVSMAVAFPIGLGVTLMQRRWISEK